MKLSDHLIELERAFALLIEAASDDLDDQEHQHRNINRVRHDLPLHRSQSQVPIIAPSFAPPAPTTKLENRLMLIKLAAFEATCHNIITPLSPDMVPLVIDSGASITVTPYETDFITPIRPVQNTEITGIASGLQVKGIGTVSYSFHNDAGELQTLNIKECLYVPQCTARLLCPRQIPSNTSCSKDIFIAGEDKALLICFGKPKTVPYDSLTNLPLLFTALGISSFTRFCANQGIIDTSPSENPFCYNMTPRQQKKLQLHERCAHVHWDQLNSWI
jgi:hypothetical protein